MIKYEITIWFIKDNVLLTELPSATMIAKWYDDDSTTGYFVWEDYQEKEGWTIKRYIKHNLIASILIKKLSEDIDDKTEAELKEQVGVPLKDERNESQS